MFLTLQESLLTNFQLIRKDIVDPPPIQFKNVVFPALTTAFQNTQELPNRTNTLEVTVRQS